MRSKRTAQQSAERSESMDGVKRLRNAKNEADLYHRELFTLMKQIENKHSGKIHDFEIGAVAKLAACYGMERFTSMDTLIAKLITRIGEHFDVIAQPAHQHWLVGKKATVMYGVNESLMGGLRHVRMEKDCSGGTHWSVWPKARVLPELVLLACDNTSLNETRKKATAFSADGVIVLLLCGGTFGTGVITDRNLLVEYYNGGGIAQATIQRDGTGFPVGWSLTAQDLGYDANAWGLTALPVVAAVPAGLDIGAVLKLSMDCYWWDAEHADPHD
eukprot:TRINITY_DN9713_c0_g2_i2.p1 TRINITY_DN9713_c0_g2~~TRINITY_DN9713_c0_g2_i2.p1  ORF type:complete len:273 (+),score=53.66 TRINITY_DN9713_c0_g2_i2:1031-1849(+)